MVSIVVTTYMEHPLLNDMLRSVFEQSSPNWELVIVDNSENHYFEEWFKNNYPDDNHNIKIINTPNTGILPGHYKLLGAKESSCSVDEFIVWLDHDDFLIPTVVENVDHITKLYPNCELITAEYTSLVRLEDEWGVNVISHIGEDVCIDRNTKSLKLIGIDFNYPDGLIRMSSNHPYRPALHPKIVRKRAILDNRFMLNITTNHDDQTIGAYGMSTLMLPEVHINDVQYCYNIHWYIPHTSCAHKVPPMENQVFRTESETCEALYNILDAHNFKKNRIIYNPIHKIFVD